MGHIGPVTAVLRKRLELGKHLFNEGSRALGGLNEDRGHMHSSQTEEPRSHSPSEGNLSLSDNGVGDYPAC